jgi:hypothetical protein
MENIVEKQPLKLKQASAVAQIPPKELQNLVQFGVVRPRRREGAYVFDTTTLLAAKMAFYLKTYLGTRTPVLSRFMRAFLSSAEALNLENPKYIVFTCRGPAGEESVKVAVPFRRLGEEIRVRLSKADLYRDLPPGRRRRGWKREFLASLAEAARDMGEISPEDILHTVRQYRKERIVPEITVAGEK